MYQCRDVLEATYRITIGNCSGTAFCVEKGEHLHFVTAKHMVCDCDDESLFINVESFRVTSCSDDRQMQLTNVHVLLGAAGVDVAVFIVPKVDDLCSISYSQLSSEGMALGEPVFLVGFPFVMSHGYMTKGPNVGQRFYLPAVKAGVVSTFEAVDGKTFLVDAYSNAGFSGGPVVMRCDNSRSVVRGVLNGFENDCYDKKPDGAINSGFATVCPIVHAVALIDRCADLPEPNAWIC